MSKELSSVETGASVSQIRHTIALAFPHTIPVLTGFLVLGMAYGVLMQSKGYSALWSVLMSAIAFCGSMQFAAVPLLLAPFHPLQALILSLMINARHLFYGLAMLDKYRGLGKSRFFLIYLLCDETFSITSSVTPPKDCSRKVFYLAISLLDYSYWVVGSLLGGLLGEFITINTKGLGFVLTALFVVLFMEQLKKKENHLPGLIGILGSLAGLLLFGPENMVIPSMIILFILLLLFRNLIQMKTGKKEVS